MAGGKTIVSGEQSMSSSTMRMGRQKQPQYCIPLLLVSCSTRRAASKPWDRPCLYAANDQSPCRRCNQTCTQSMLCSRVPDLRRKTTTELHGSGDDIFAPQTGRPSGKRVVTATTDFHLRQMTNAMPLSTSNVSAVPDPSSTWSEAPRNPWVLRDTIACMQHCPLSLSGKPSIAAAVDRTLLDYQSPFAPRRDTR